MNRTFRTMLLLAALTGAAGCKDSNSTITFDATTASDGKGDGGAAPDGGKSDGSTPSDSGAAPDGGGTSIDADGDGASDTGSADAEQGQ
jgi:hypothetical protein